MSLMEILVVLAIFALATAVVLPGSARMLDQATAQAVFFEFQRDVSNLRREANRTGESLRLVDPEAETDPERGERVLTLRAPWRYTLAPALDIAEGGGCSTSTANLLNGDRVVMTLRTTEGDCRFIRRLPAAGPPRAPSSR